MEGTGIIPSGHIRIKQVAVALSAALRCFRQNPLHRALNAAGRRVALSGNNLPGLRESQEFIRFVPEELHSRFLQFHFVFRFNAVQEFIRCVARHHHGIHAFTPGVQGNRIPDAEFIILHGKEGHMAFHIFFIAALQGHRVHGAGFLQVFHTQELKEVEAFLFRVLQQFRTAHFPAEIGIKDHGAHHHRAGEQAFVCLAG